MMLFLLGLVLGVVWMFAVATWMDAHCDHVWAEECGHCILCGERRKRGEAT